MDVPDAPCPTPLAQRPILGRAYSLGVFLDDAFEIAPRRRFGSTRKADESPSDGEQQSEAESKRKHLNKNKRHGGEGKRTWPYTDKRHIGYPKVYLCSVYFTNQYTGRDMVSWNVISKLDRTVIQIENRCRRLKQRFHGSS